MLSSLQGWRAGYPKPPMHIDGRACTNFSRFPVFREMSSTSCSNVQDIAVKDAGRGASAPSCLSAAVGSCDAGDIQRPANKNPDPQNPETKQLRPIAASTNRGTGRIEFHREWAGRAYVPALTAIAQEYGRPDRLLPIDKTNTCCPPGPGLLRGRR